MKLNVFILFACLVFGLVGQAQASQIDNRFRMHFNAQDYPEINVDEALAQSLTTLWKRVVPQSYLGKAQRLKGRSSMVLQFKKQQHGVDLVLNPVQVKAYLHAYGIPMVYVKPNWNLKIFVQGFSDTDDGIAKDLMDYSYGLADEFGFELSQRGKKMQLIFSPVMDVYGATLAHVDIQSALAMEVIAQTNQVQQGSLEYQLQDWVHEILIKMRDAYSLETLAFNEVSTERMLTIESEATLSTQIMLEQALKDNARVRELVPQLLQKARRQYLLVLRDDDDAWMIEWASSFGLTATSIVEDGIKHWFLE